MITGKTVRRQIQEQFLEAFARCQGRHAFMTNVPGIEVPEEMLPLANIPAIVPPPFRNPATSWQLSSDM